MSDNRRDDSHPSKLLDWITLPLQSKRGRLFLGTLSLSLALILIAAAGGLWGYLSGRNEVRAVETVESRAYLEEQYRLGVEDLEAGRLDLARQRFEYIMNKDERFQAAIDRYIEVIGILYATAPPPPPPATITPTPTLDLRPIEDLWIQAQALIASEQWDQALETLAAIRQVDPTFKIIEVDGLIYLGLRNRGLDKIRSRGELEEGLFDFTLAENFAPLDVEANNYRTWARYYLMGNGFWEAYPETAAYYYALASSYAPSLKDASGMTAFYRYWSSLKQQAEIYIETEDWCAASEQYKLVVDAWAENEAVEVATQVYDNCLIAIAPTATPAPTITPTPTGTISITTTPSTNTLTPTSTLTPDGTATITPTPTDTPAGATNTPTNTPLPPIQTDTPTNTTQPATATDPPPPATATDTLPPTATDTEVPSPTEAPEP
jgi:hypothetical protein